MTAKKEFGADSELKRLYQVYLLFFLIGGLLWWMVPIVAFVMLEMQTGLIALASFLPLLLIAAIILYWIPRFHSSITYVLEDDKIIVTKGVWWKTKSLVPYNRITNVHIDQGPISRFFGLGKLSIQTAGFSGTGSSGVKVAEAVIFGIKNFEEIEDLVMDSVKGIKPMAIEAETKPSRDVNLQILEELRKIRKAVEK